MKALDRAMAGFVGAAGLLFGAAASGAFALEVDPLSIPPAELLSSIKAAQSPDLPELEPQPVLACSDTLTKELLGLKKEYKDRILEVQAVVGVYATKSDPALVIVLAGKISEAFLREQLLETVPEIACVPFRFDMSGRVPPEQKRTCWLPEGCGELK